MRKALIVGVSHYDYHQPLRASVKDAKNVHELLQFHEGGEINFKCELWVSSTYPERKITRQNLHRALRQLFKKGDEDVTTVLFYFSGHGSENNLGGYIMTQEAAEEVDGISLNDIMIYANNSQIENIVIILDSCYSGNMGKIAHFNSPATTLRHGITVISSSTDSEESTERINGGIFTQALCKALEGMAADILGEVDAVGIYGFVSAALMSEKQTPTLKASVKYSPILRKVTPQISTRDLTQISLLFSRELSSRKLNPAYINKTQSLLDKGIDEEEMLRKYYKAGLIVVEDNLAFDEGMNQNKTCRLTKMGKFYHQKFKHEL